MIAVTSAIIPVLLLTTNSQESLVCRNAQLWQCAPVFDAVGWVEITKPNATQISSSVTPVGFHYSSTQPTQSKQSKGEQLIAGAEDFNRILQQLPRPTVPVSPATPKPEELPPLLPRYIIAPPPPPPTITPTLTPVAMPHEPAAIPSLPSIPIVAAPIAASGVKPPPRLTLEADKIAARRAWSYFERNWNPQTGFVNSVENYAWTTWWDQGSAILGIHAAYQLGLIDKAKFNRMSDRFLKTLENLPLPATGLPNKAYSTNTAQMRRLDNTPDPRGSSGWSVLDQARLLMGLHVIRTHYPEYKDRIERLVKRWKLSKLVQSGWLYGGITDRQGKFITVQEGRLGYEQYAAYSLKLWGIEAANALYNLPVQTIEVDGITLQVDRRNLQNSGASNHLTNDPYLLWGLELGWPDSVKTQVLNLLKVQAQRFRRTGILTAVNEDSIDRQPYFLYYSIYADGRSWNAINVRGQSHPQLRFVSTKAAFAWQALMQDDAYTTTLRNAVQNLAAPNRGYFSGRYENPRLGANASINVNTNAIILESLLYQARGRRSLAF
jgi:Protein of unknown function (DUF3131)